MNTSQQNNRIDYPAKSTRRRTRASRGGNAKWSLVLKAALIVAIAGLLAVGCRHPIGIFANLEEEIPVDEERGVPTEDGMRGMLATDTGPDSEGYFYAAFTSLYVRERSEDVDLGADSPSSDWSKVSKPSGLDDDYVLTSIAYHQGRIFAVYAGDDSGSLYYRDADGEKGSDGWVEIPVDEIAGSETEKVSRVLGSGDGGDEELIVSILVDRSDESDTYGIWRLDGSEP
ncbi:MAG: hypothetical protein ACLFM0_08775, partial [Spirochaetales bacterium]